MHQHRPVIVKKAHSLADSASGIQQHVCLIGQTDIKPKVIMLLKESLNLRCKVVYVDYKSIKPGSRKMAQLVFQHSTPANLYECLRTVRRKLT
jgi:hypothetical protein